MYIIGIETKGAHLLSRELQKMANIIIVKVVCDLDARKYSETYQPTAALLAADLVYESLNNVHVHKLFTGLFIFADQVCSYLHSVIKH